jgi:predicted RNase H-like nuclease (RuvC/YqgF family)
MSASLPFAWLTTALLCLPATLWAQAAAKPAAPAQGKISTFGDAKAGGKLLTRNELRACLKDQTALAERRPKVEAERDAVQREMDEIKQLDEALKADASAVESIKTGVASLNERNQELSRKIADFNERMIKFQESPRSGPSAERQRSNFETEKVALDKSAQELAAERTAFTSKSEQTLKVYNARVTARDKAAGEWNAKNAQSAKLVQAYETDRETWAADCAGRPYREDDEIAIKSGK